MAKTLIAIKVASDICKLIADDAYKSLKEAIGGRAVKDEIEISIGNLYTRSKQFRKVKTLWQVDTPVDIKDFYCDTYIKNKKRRKLINYYSDFENDGNILIEGIAGQGKSIFLRYLLSKEIERGELVPVFVELRRIQENMTIYDLVLMSLKALGFNVPDKMFDILSKTEKLLLLLDGFDEIEYEKQKSAISEIENMISSNDGIKFVITSRPNSGLEYSPFLNVYRIDALQGEEYKRIFEKLLDDRDLIQQLSGQITKHKGKIKDLLTTPLMVTMLIITYKSFGRIPDSLSDFYGSIFNILLQRHDGIKPGFTRRRHCIMNDLQYKDVFETMCLFSKKETNTYPYEVLNKHANTAIKLNKLSVDPQAYLKDIVGITCLILKDGEEYKYIHKSVREYYASSFIARQNENNAQRFYERLLSGDYTSWHQELMYLREIDKYKYLKYFLVPLLSSLLYESPSDAGKEILFNEGLINRILMHFKFEVRYISYKDERAHLVFGCYNALRIITNSQMFELFKYIDKYEADIKKNILTQYSTRDGGILIADYIKIASKELIPNIKADLTPVIEKIVKHISRVCSDSNIYIKDEDQKLNSIDLFKP